MDRMSVGQYREAVEREVYYEGKPKGIIQKLRVKYLRPDTNCTYLARKMWYLYGREG